MKRTIKFLTLSFVTALILSSCNNSGSLQGYFVDHQESANFLSQDIPLSMVKIDKTKFTEEQKEAYNSVKRLNFLGYKIDGTDTKTYQTELTKVKTILNDKKYNDLMEFSTKGNKVLVKYLGNDDEADEVVLFGSSKEMGFAIVRILGNDMNPEKMMTLAGALQTADMDVSQMQEMINFFK